jgi:hypothetical protein
MRAREFVRRNLKEETVLPPEQADPMRYTYIIPGLSAADPYKNYRFGVAMARARSDYADSTSEQNKSIDPYIEAWSAESVFGEHGVVAGMTPAIAQVIDTALAMTGTPGGKKLVSSPDSREPAFVDTKSPVTAFKGYPR